MASTGVITSVAPARIFYGWWMVLATAVALAAGPILIASTFGIFVKPLAETFGWSRGAISLGFSITACIGSLAAPVVGVLADRLGPRKVILGAAVLFGSGLCSFAFLSGSIWHFYALYVFTAFGGIGLTTIPYATAISRWFVRQRGLALGFMGVGAFVGGMYAPPLVTYVIATWGWRWAYATLGLLVWILILPVIGLFLIESPRQLGLRPDGDTEDGNSPPVSLSLASPSREYTFTEARVTAPFWLMAVSFFLLSATIHGCITHLAPLLTDHGLSAQQAATALILFSAMGAIGRVTTGYLVDHFPSHLVATSYFLAVVIGLLAALGSSDERLALLFAAMLGLGFGAESDIMPYLTSRYFGLKAFGEIYGWLFGAFAFGAVLGPLLMGLVFDATGSYRLALLMFIPATALGAGLMLPLGKRQSAAPAL